MVTIELQRTHTLCALSMHFQGRFTIYAWASVATGSAYKMIWTHVAMCTYAGIEIISIPAYATRVQIILYALLFATRRRQIRYARSSVYCEPAFRVLHMQRNTALHVLSRLSSLTKAEPEILLHARINKNHLLEHTTAASSTYSSLEGVVCC